MLLRIIYESLLCFRTILWAHKCVVVRVENVGSYGRLHVCIFCGLINFRDYWLNQKMPITLQVHQASTLKDLLCENYIK